MSAAATLVHLPPPRPDHSFTKRPSSRLAVFWWRRRMWFESTFVLSMLEPWEKVLLLTMFGLLFALLFSGILKYSPIISSSSNSAPYTICGVRKAMSAPLAVARASTAVESSPAVASTPVLGLLHKEF
ncbi:hypothetical protein CPB84DRAFT_976487 [Gymnopilus junonius]|uniref:Uncharacterized protein n=1 Tax=Gymnopilus junonius TaxID=109634 RepID=A0A9P5TNK9_GYMJU|nr:hypothetical protein CPB84DRAFT_976487 [Gymnopilus junonius]